MQAQYPDQPLLKQIDTRPREIPAPFETEAQKSRRANGWEPQSEGTGAFAFEGPGPSDWQ